MNGKNIIGIVITILMVTSGPVYLPLAKATANQTAGSGHIQPSVSLTVTRQDGVSPLPIQLTCDVFDPEAAGGVLLYRWDFDGDGLSDTVTERENTVLHIYETKREKSFNVTVTVGFMDGTYKEARTEIRVKPVDYSKWYEIREIGTSKLGVMRNGTLVVYDESSWLPITFTESNVKLSENSFHGLDRTSRRLSYPLLTDAST